MYITWTRIWFCNLYGYYSCQTITVVVKLIMKYSIPGIFWTKPPGIRESWKIRLGIRQFLKNVRECGIQNPLPLPILWHLIYDYLFAFSFSWELVCLRYFRIGCIIVWISLFQDLLKRSDWDFWDNYDFTISTYHVKCISITEAGRIIG